jgi:hypothetical protein
MNDIAEGGEESMIELMLFEEVRDPRPCSMRCACGH